MLKESRLVEFQIRMFLQILHLPAQTVTNACPKSTCYVTWAMPSNDKSYHELWPVYKDKKQFIN